MHAELDRPFPVARAARARRSGRGTRLPARFHRVLPGKRIRLPCRPHRGDRRRRHASLCGAPDRQPARASARHQPRTSRVPHRCGAGLDARRHRIGARGTLHGGPPLAPLGPARAAGRRSRRRTRPERCGARQSGHGPHAGLRDLDQWPLRQLSRRRWNRRCHRNGLHRLCALLRRSHRGARSRRVGARAHLAAHVERPADRGACGQHGSDPPVEGASTTITLLHPPGYDYYRLLRSKLHWGRGGQHNGGGSC